MLYQLSYTRSRKSGRANYRIKGGLQPRFSRFFQRIPPHEVGEHAVVAQGVGTVAKVGLHLQQPLLQCRAPQRDTPTTKEPLSHKFEPRVVLRLGPGEVAMLDAGNETGVAIGRCAGVEPWQDDVDGNVVQSPGAKQRLRRRKPPGAKGPVPGPVVVTGGEAAQQRGGG